MQNNPILILNKEHDVIELAEVALSNLRDEWKNNPTHFTSEMEKILDFFKEYADEFHHRKEEEILFPAIKANPNFSLPELIDEFVDHHESFREYSDEIAQNLNEKNYERAYQIVCQYMSDLKDHIAAENDELFVLAETLIDEEELEEIYFRFIDLDMELGITRKQEYEDVMQVLS